MLVIEESDRKLSTMKKCVSYQFFQFAERHYPKLIGNKAYRNLFLFLCFSNWTDKETGYLLIPHAALQNCAGIPYDNHAWSSGKFLENFQRDVLPNLQYTDWHWKASQVADNWSATGTCRRVTDRGFDLLTREQIQEELRNPPSMEEKYYFDSGRKRTKQLAAEQTTTAKQEYELQFQQFKKHLNQPQKLILAELIHTANNGKAFSEKLHKNQDRIQLAIASMQLDSTDKLSLSEKQDRQRSILASIGEEARVFYAPTKFLRTCRLHATGDSVVSLHSPIRKALCHGWHEVDLVSSQFIILSNLLKAPFAMRLINDRVHLWTYLHDYITGHWEKPNPQQKEHYKQIIYGMCFGMSRAELADRAKRAGVDKILEHPMIHEILERRAAWFKMIGQQGYVEDVWGKKHLLEAPGSKKDIYGDIHYCKERWEGSLAATKIQSIEMEIISGAYEQLYFNKKNWKCRVMIHQHDGFTLSAYDTKNTHTWQEGLQEGISIKSKEVGKQLGIDLSHMRLEYTLL